LWSLLCLLCRLRYLLSCLLCLNRRLLCLLYLLPLLDSYLSFNLS
jgi:hypothetical protein